MRRTPPKWRDEAMALLKEGHTYMELAQRYGVHESYVRQQAGPNRKAHLIHGLGPAQKQALGLPRKVSMDEARAFLENNQPFSDDIVEGFMADRQFTPVKVWDHGKSKNGVKIECSKKIAPDCLKNQEFFLSVGGKPNPSHVANNFRASGWIVGGGPRADCCPKCYEYSRRALKHDKPPEVAAPVATVKEAVIDMNAAAPQPVASTGPLKLRDIGKTEKRLIDMKLDEVYDASKGGFQQDWSDAKIAEELKCPIEWVSLVRNEFHGPDVRPVDHSKEIAALRELAAKVQESRKHVDIAIERLTEHDNIMNDRLKAYEKQATLFQEAYAEFIRKVNGTV